MPIGHWQMPSMQVASPRQVWVDLQREPTGTFRSDMHSPDFGTVPNGHSQMPKRQVEPPEHRSFPVGQESPNDTWIEHL